MVVERTRDWVDFDIGTVDAEAAEWVRRQAGARQVRMGEIVNRLVDLAILARGDGSSTLLAEANLETMEL